MTSPAHTNPVDISDPAELIRTLRALGIELWTEGGALRYRAPHAVFTDE